MIWTVINLLLVGIGAYGMHWGIAHVQRRTPLDALLPTFGGLALVLIGVASSAIQIIWF